MEPRERVAAIEFFMSEIAGTTEGLDHLSARQVSDVRSWYL
jgi:hypothetical protein